MHKDPVCGMEFSHENFTWEFKGESYFFCSQGCLEKFKTSPSELSGNMGAHRHSQAKGNHHHEHHHVHDQEHHEAKT